MSAPTIPTGLLDSPIFQEIGPKKRWILWDRFVTLDAKKVRVDAGQVAELKARGERVLKVPLVPLTGRFTSVNQDHASDWTTLDEALRLAARYPCAGLGFVLGDGVGGLDIDGARQSTAAKLDWAMTIINGRESYCELSPSELGVHVLFKSDGTYEDVKRDGVELYRREAGRYFTVGFKPVRGFPLELRPAPMAVAAALERAGAVSKTAVTTAPVIETATPTAAAPPANVTTLPHGSLPENAGQGGDAGDDGGDLVDGDALAGDSNSPMRRVNDVAIAKLDAWFPQAFPDAVKQANSAWRIEPDKLGREGGNGLSALKGKGIVDHWHAIGGAESEDRFGAGGDPRHGRRSPVDMLIDPEYAEIRAEEWTATTPKRAALLLCQKLGLHDLEPVFTKPVRRDFVDILEMADTSMTTPPWPAGTLPESIEQHAAHVARRTCAAEAVGQFGHLMALAAMIPMGIEIDVLRDGSYTRGAGLYSMLVGRSGSSKSAALNMALNPLYGAEAKWTKEFKRDFAEWKQREEAAKAADATRKRNAKVKTAEPDAPDSETAGQGGGDQIGPAPVLRRRLMQDATVEKLAVVMGEKTEGLIVHRDELAGFFGGLDKYSKGSRGGSTDSAAFLQMYDGAAIRVDRMSRDAVALDKTHLSVMGTIQPSILAPMLAGLGADGLLQRFLVCAVGEPTVARDAEPLDPLLTAVFDETATRLLEMRREFGEMTFRPSLEALEVWREADAWTRSDGLPLARSEAERGFVSKLPDLLARVGLALHLLDWAAAAPNSDFETATAPKREIGPDTMRRAWRWLREFAVPNVRMVYHGADRAARLDAAKEVARWIKSRVGVERKGFGLRDLYRAIRRYREREHQSEMWTALDDLEMNGWIVSKGDKAWTISETVFAKQLLVA